MKWFFVVLKKYVTFSGRAHRPEFWWFSLVALIIAAILVGIDMATHTFDRDAGMGLLSGIFLLATLLPTWAVSVRRLHDTGKSGWWCLLSLIPFVGALILLIMYAQPSDHGSNRYGADPYTGT